YQSGPFVGKVGLEAIKSRRPHEIGFRQDEFGNVISLVQFAPSGEILLPREKFVVHTYQSEFSNPYGCSDLEAAYRAWFNKDMAYKWLGMLLERFGIPPIFALYNPNRYQGAALDNLKDIVANLQAATAGIIPRNSSEDLEMWTPEIASQVGRVFIPALDLYDKHIAKALLIPTLLGITPEESVGSMARAQIVFDSFMLLVQKLREEIEDVVAEQIVNPLVRMNFPVSDDYPRWILAPIPDARRTELLAQWATMLGVNAVRQGPDDEAHIRKVLEFPENDDPIEGAEEEEDPEEKPEENSGEKPEEGDEEEDEQRDEAKMSQEQQIGDFLDATEDKLRVDLSAIMERSRDKLIILIEAKRPQRELLSFEIPQARIREAVGASMVSVFEKGALDLKREVKAEFDIGKALKDAKAAVRQIKARAFEIARNIQAEISGAVRRVILDGNDLGDLDQGTVGQIKESFEQWVDTRAIDPQTQKEIKKEANRLATIVRNEVTDSYNRGRLVAARDPALKAFIVGMKSNAILDENTTEVCRFLDGKVFLIDDPDLDNLRPPRHHNALAAGELIRTKCGEKPIEEVSIGDLVWTHRSRWRPVYSVMYRAFDGAIRKIKTPSVRSILITEEHPVLTRHGWRKAGELQPGDQLFERQQQRERSSRDAIVDPQDFPTLFDEEFVAWDSVKTALSYSLCAVNLNGNPMLHEREVDHESINRVLEYEWHAERGEDRKQIAFGLCRVFARMIAERLGHLCSRRVRAHWVEFCHSLGMSHKQLVRFLSQSMSPMVY
ncbi:MAG: DUF935 family protein, partial [Nitrososphaera sp.]|nr:DUF935 family protein [Nitrososphaera sp.]